MADARSQGKAQGLPLDTRWHLGESEREGALAELEYSMFRTFAAFDRWQSECLAAVLGRPMSSTENAVLHVIRMKERPKTVTEIGQLLNRSDTPNLQYALRKLQQTGLIEKLSPARRRGAAYQVTEEGRRVTERYAALRRELLVPLAEELADWDERILATRRQLDIMRGMYEQAAVFVATHRGEAGG